MCLNFDNQKHDQNYIERSLVCNSGCGLSCRPAHYILFVECKYATGALYQSISSLIDGRQLRTQRLNQSGLVETKRGANGGSVLARPATKINLREVYESVCLVSELFARHPKAEGAVSNIIGEYINNFYSEAEKVMFSHLESKCVADMDAEVRPRIISALQCK